VTRKDSGSIYDPGEGFCLTEMLAELKLSADDRGFAQRHAQCASRFANDGARKRTSRVRL
jgi:hypothetical protein